MNDKINWSQKLSSRKFWIAVAAVLAEIGCGAWGVIPADVATWCALGSVCIYIFCESWVDASRAKANQSITEKSEVLETTNSTAVSASTTSAATVDKLIAAPTAEDTKVGGTA